MAVLPNCSDDTDPFLNNFHFWMGTVVAHLITIPGFFLTMFTVRAVWKLQHSSVFYLLPLCFYDIVMYITYTLLMGVSCMRDYFNVPSLHEFWLVYSAELLAVSRIIQAAQRFTVLAVVVERFVMIRRHLVKKPITVTRNVRLCISIFTFTLSCISQGYSFFQTKRELCQTYNGTLKYKLTQVPVGDGDSFYTYQKIVEPFIQVYIPFVLLVAFNTGIIHQLKTKLKIPSISSDRRSVPVTRRMDSMVRRINETKNELHDATMTSIGLSSIYVLGATINVVLTMMEGICPSVLDANYNEYQISINISSISVMLASALRPLVYYKCNTAIRLQMRSYFFSQRRGHMRVNRLDSQEWQDEILIQNTVTIQIVCAKPTES